MGQKTALFITVVLTIFVVGAGGMLAQYMSHNQDTPSTAITEASLTTETVDATVEGLRGVT